MRLYNDCHRADWFHWSGITPAISDKAAELTRLACEAAKRHGVTVSVDLNFRKKLWTKEKAQSIMKPLMQYVDVCIGNEEDAELCLGFKPDADVEGGKTDAEGYKGIFKAMAKEFGFKYVISTLRESFSATHNGWKAMIYNGEEFYESKRYDKPMEVFDYNALKDDPLIEVDTIGLKGSPTNVFKSFTPPQKGAGTMLTGDDTAAQLAGILAKKHLI